MKVVLIVIVDAVYNFPCRLPATSIEAQGRRALYYFITSGLEGGWQSYMAHTLTHTHLHTCRQIHIHTYTKQKTHTYMLTKKKKNIILQREYLFQLQYIREFVHSFPIYWWKKYIYINLHTSIFRIVFTYKGMWKVYIWWSREKFC